MFISKTGQYRTCLYLKQVNMEHVYNMFISKTGQYRTCLNHFSYKC